MLLYLILLVVTALLPGCFARCDSKFDEVMLLQREGAAWNEIIHKYRLSTNHWNTELFDAAEFHFNNIKKDFHYCDIGVCQTLWDDVAYIVHHGFQLDDPNSFESSLYTTIKTCIDKFAICDACGMNYIHQNICDFRCD